ncbi:hypothetical protein AVHY2522_19570 [Acidovorax sp. SUPP2522]|uniref:hypothetical protein n=1 Tax=unclassified Acidovorax TaxID=2684926 RepID=UPI00234ADD3C|nr:MULTISPECIES: hypothetical protein [unclassified Acidovorax]WCM96514.1 hypothetical protein M5C96_19080 [Acidovorax sp. GBBC 1281]GKT18637.1 hypothetical protein AVHY2522_19570 [Acidovorax sp. SUPP2522]
MSAMQGPAFFIGPIENVNGQCYENEMNFAFLALVSRGKHGAVGGDQELIRV